MAKIPEAPFRVAALSITLPARRRDHEIQVEFVPLVAG
jgi:hypothetical protein